MPTGIVQTPEDERLWKKAKALARKEYPNVKEGTRRWYKIVMGIFKRMKGGK